MEDVEEASKARKKSCLLALAVRAPHRLVAEGSRNASPVTRSGAASLS
jgi:hypothetical protein